MYRKVDTSLDFVPREKEILEFWREIDVFNACTEHRRGGEPYTFFDGPPTANGKPHIGHVLTRCIKDLVPRYKSMKGFDVMRKAGWDTHGLPVELEVEKQLGLDGKDQIEEYGVEEFIHKCKESVWSYKGEWEEMSERVAFWADMDDPYITYENYYIESCWWAIKEIYDKGLLYKGHKTVPYCPRCGTALSSHELAQGYEDVEDTSVIAKFKLVGEDSTYVLAWTTTPWTLPSNLALCVNAKESYAKVECNGEVYIMAEALLDSVLGEGNYKKLSVCKGKELEKLHYEPLFDFKVELSGKDAHYILSDPYVSLEDGTGIVHIAPAFGEDDARIGQAWDLPFVQLVDSKGNMAGGTPWDGMYVKDADFAVIDRLKETNLLFREMKFEHNYPFCWRCHTPLIYYARKSWFIKMTAVRDKLVEFNRRVNWVPANIKEGRMGNFVENVIDWGVSRERYWGTPLPVWECKCGHTHVVGSVEELKKLGRDVPEDIELHKPYIDDVKLYCPECGELMVREPEVLDCWFDSGAMSFAQFHYPFENKDLFEKRYPADFISEAVDQTRGWFYTLLALSTCLFEDPSFLNCIVLGHVQDKEGRKMSKHIGNVVDPWVVLNKQGADAVRWYFYTAAMPWLPNRFYDQAVDESQRKFMGTLWNTYAFYVLYAEIDKFNPFEHNLKVENLTEMDRFILSRLHTVTGEMTTYLDAMKITEAGRLLQSFVDEVSNWYVRRSRERFWGKDMTDDKEAAYMTLFSVLETAARLSAPFTPFMAEMIYQNIVRSVNKDALVSIHLCDFPVKDDAFIAEELERNMKRVLDLVVLGRSARNTAGIKNRQPLSKIMVQGAALDKGYANIILDELNIKSIEFIEDASSFIAYRAKPQLKTLGPRYGKLLNKISEHLSGDGVGDKVVAAHNDGLNYEFNLDGETISLAIEDVLIELMQKPGYVAMSERDNSVVIDTTLTLGLIDEGFVREIVSKVQTMRKEAGYEVTDNINITFSGSEKAADIFNRFNGDIALDTLAKSIKAVDAPSGFVKEWDINGENAVIGVEKA